MLTANFSGGLTVTVEATTVLKNTQHFFVSTDADVTLLGAETNLPGRLLLSDSQLRGRQEGRQEVGKPVDTSGA